MRFLVALFICVLGFQFEAGAQLAEQAQARVYERQLQQAMEQDDAAAALVIVANYRRDISVVPPVIFFIEARLARDEGQYERSLIAIQSYLNTASEDEPQYDAAIELYAEVEPLAAAERRQAAAREAGRLEREQRARLHAQRSALNRANQEFIDAAQTAFAFMGGRITETTQRYLAPTNVRFESFGDLIPESRRRALVEIQRAASGRRNNLVRRLSEVEANEMISSARVSMDGIDRSDFFRTSGPFPNELVLASYDRPVVPPDILGQILIETRSRIEPDYYGRRRFYPRQVGAGRREPYLDNFPLLSRFTERNIYIAPAFEGDLARLAVRGQLNLDALNLLVDPDTLVEDVAGIIVRQDGSRVRRSAHQIFYHAVGPAIVIADIAEHGLHDLDTTDAVQIMSVLDRGRRHAIVNGRQISSEPTLGAYVHTGGQLFPLGALILRSDRLEESDKVGLFAALEQVYFDPEEGDLTQFWQQQEFVPGSCDWDANIRAISSDFTEVNLRCVGATFFSSCTIPYTYDLIVEFFRERGIEADCGEVQ
jgi:hypothetical protein